MENLPSLVSTRYTDAYGAYTHNRANEESNYLLFTESTAKIITHNSVQAIPFNESSDVGLYPMCPCITT